MDTDTSEEQLIDSEQELDQSPSQTDAPLQDEQQEEVTEEAPQEEPQQEEAPAETEPEPQPSRRENLRIQQVLSKLKQSGEGHRQQQQRTAPELNYREMIDAPDEVYEQLEQRTRQYGDSVAKDTLKTIETVRWENRLEMDAPRVASKYSYLDASNNDAFQPAVADAINNWYLQMSGYDPSTNTVESPSIRYEEFVESINELAEVIAETKVRSTRTNITRQAATTGLRPDGSSSKRLNLNKLPQDMTDEELQAVISQGLPK